MLGQTLSHYRVTARIGAGGMGEVYRATDTKLGRDVALKILPPEVATDPERLARFEREAKLLAALNHPNIAAIHGFEEAGGRPFLALELVEGEDLKQRLDRGAIPVGEALEIALQVAEALEEAHGKGIVHRDLKPANVKLTPGGKVKVLDFGLAKAWAGEADGSGSSSPALSQSPTLARTGTIAGVILGTAAYMSPEQARGKAVDKRADVWSFGVLLWEMLTGRALFAGETVTDVIAAVVSREPDLDVLPPTAPAAVRKLIARCLRKDPRQRLPDIGAARLELQEAIAAATSGAAAGESAAQKAGGGRSRLTRARLAGAALGLALLTGAAFLGRLSSPGPALPVEVPLAQFAFEAPPVAVASGGSPGPGSFIAAPPAFSSDGRSLVFVRSQDANAGLLQIRTLDSLETRSLPGTEGAWSPFWSPDGTTVAFSSGNELRRISLASGTVQKICSLPQPAFGGGTWNAGGTIVFATGGLNSALYSVPAAGGEPKALPSPDPARGEIGHYYPQFLEDGSRFLYTISARQLDRVGVFVSSLDAPGQKQRILSAFARAQYVPPGYLLASQTGVVTAQRFDARRLAAVGDPAPIASSVTTPWGFIGCYAVSPNGVLAWLDDGAQASRLEWRGRDGRGLGSLGDEGRYDQITLSPDGSRIAAQVLTDAGAEIRIIDVGRGVGRRLAGGGTHPVWSSDGQEIAYVSKDGTLVRQPLHAGQPPVPIPVGRDDLVSIPRSWAPDGTVLYVSFAERGQALWARPASGEGAGKKILESEFVVEPQLSPDGRWLAQVAPDSGQWNVFVEPFGHAGERVRVSPQGGRQPRWRGDGKELFYLSDAGLMAVDVRASDEGATVSLPTRLMNPAEFDALITNNLDSDGSDYAVAADGRRFLFKIVTSRQPQRMHVLVNWPSLLSPAGRP